MWIRYCLETYFEYAISCLVGIGLRAAILPLEMSIPDVVSQATAILTLIIAVLFAYLVGYYSLHKGANLFNLHNGINLA